MDEQKRLNEILAVQRQWQADHPNKSLTDVMRYQTPTGLTNGWSYMVFADTTFYWVSGETAKFGGTTNVFFRNGKSL